MSTPTTRAQGPRTVVIEGCAIATVDDERREFADGHIVVAGDRIAAIGAGPAPTELLDEATRRIDGRGCLATPGLVNCHHHLYQSATRGLAQDATLFEWLVALYPTWARIDGDVVQAAASAGLAGLALSGCTTSSDHHYVFPRCAGDLLGVEIDCARRIGLRFHPCRGAMDLGAGAGGLPPDHVVEERDAILQASADAIDRYHDASPGAMVRIALAPTSPFSVTRELLVETAELARARGVRLHTHLAETIEEEHFCLERFGVRPLDYLDELGWLGADVWLAHCVHLDHSEVARMASTHTGVAHCPSSNARLGAGIAAVMELVAAGAAVGLGVDGAASQEAGELGPEMRAALLFQRARHGPRAMTVRTALELGTRHGARCLGWEDELGQLSAGALADIALWRLDDLGHAGIADPVGALVLGPSRPVQTLLVGGRVVVQDAQLRTADPATLASELTRVARKLAVAAS